uniref:DNA-directed RNA polymerase subunit n=1 Tax=Scapholeberis mucronata TaxID=202097 RepID=A0A4Y7NLA6_9CRUS|nr:EOG090X0LKA [Scapholeberis mucronata]
MSSKTSSIFDSDVNFCPQCGAILPTLGNKGGLACQVCRHEVDIEIMEELEVKYVVEFNSRSEYIEEQQLKSAQSKSDGPIVERRCPKCGNDTMSYASLQLRSADEGQTIFYTCTKCQFKETENS